MRILKTLLLLACVFGSFVQAQDENETNALELVRFVNPSSEEIQIPEEKAETKVTPPSKRKAAGDGESETEVSVDYTRQYLTNGRGTWDEARMSLVHKFTKRKVLYASFAETLRFGRRDRNAMVGFYQPIDKNWTLLVEAGVSPTHRVVEKWSAMAQVERYLGDGWIGSAGFRRVEHATAKVNITKLGVEKYWGRNLAAYMLSINNLEGNGTSQSQRVRYNRYYNRETSTVGVSLSAGREIESTGPNTVLQSTVYNFTISGKHYFTRHWAIGYGLTNHKQGDIYTRRGFNFGLRYKF